MTHSAMPSIFDFAAYGDFLKSAYEAQHALTPTFSYDYIANETELKSRTYVRNIIKGIQTPTPSELTKLGILFGLDSDEQRYLSCLYQFQKAQSRGVALKLFEQLMKFQEVRPPEANPFREVETTASALSMTLLSALHIKGVEHTPAALGAFLKNRYSVLEIQNALLSLNALGYIEPAEPGRFKTAQRYIRKYDMDANIFLQNFHSDQLSIAKKALENEAVSERYLVGTNINIPAQAFPKIVQKINSFIETLLRTEGALPHSDCVIQLSTQLVKVSQVSEEKQSQDSRVKPGVSALLKSIDDVIV